MLKIRSDKGFGAIEGILIIVIIGMVGGLGWYILKQNKAAKTTPTTSASKTTKPDPGVLSPPEAKISYLSIPQWGTKVPLTTGASLSYSANKTIGSFRSKELDTFSGACSTNTIDVARGKATDVVPNEVNDPNGSKFEEAYQSAKTQLKDTPSSQIVAAKVGDYYYVLPGYRGASCSTDNQTQAEEDALRLAITKAINLMIAE